MSTTYTNNGPIYLTAEQFEEITPVLGQEYCITGSLSETEIPSLSASKISSGTFSTDRIPSLPASKITSGTFADARIASASTWNAKQDALGYTAEDNSNKVTSVSSSSTDTEYPSAKCVYDLVGDIESLLEALR